MDDTERDILEQSHRQDLHEQSCHHYREENEQQHQVMNSRIDSVVITVNGHETRIEVLEQKGTQAKARVVDGVVKWVLALLGLALTSGAMFLLGTIFGGAR